MLNFLFIILIFTPLFYQNKTSGVFLLENVSEIIRDSVWVSKYEVSNRLYQEFTDKEGGVHLPNESLWKSYPVINKDYAQFYFKHPAYRDYPVVNITKEDAEAFCRWKTQQLNESKQLPFEVTVRLPTEDEWEKMALGGIPAYNSYPWGNNELRVKTGKLKGILKANFRVKNNSVYFIGNKKYKREDVLTPVDAYLPNGFGIFNVCGNVAEITAEGKLKGGSWYSFPEDGTIRSSETYQKPEPYIGFRYLIEKAN